MKADLAWDDPFRLDDQLNADERAVRDTARESRQGKLRSPAAGRR